VLEGAPDAAASVSLHLPAELLPSLSKVSPPPLIGRTVPQSCFPFLCVQPFTPWYCIGSKTGLWGHRQAPASFQAANPGWHGLTTGKSKESNPTAHPSTPPLQPGPCQGINQLGDMDDPMDECGWPWWKVLGAGDWWSRCRYEGESKSIGPPIVRARAAGQPWAAAQRGRGLLADPRPRPPGPPGPWQGSSASRQRSSSTAWWG
jgi:hypothetical protein